MPDSKYTLLFDADGQTVGLHFSPDLWQQVEADVLPILQAACGETPGEEEPPPEPMRDWDDLVAYWDFPYPVERSVECGECGAATEDWQADDPRKFRLKACNFGGLVSFQCQSCKARVTKRHFKDGITFDSVPYAE